MASPHAPQASHAGTPKLLDRLRTAIRLRHFSRRTEEAYAGWVRRYILLHRKRHPSEMAEAEVTAFLTHLAQGRGVPASTQNQALRALLFLYRHLLGREPGALEGLVCGEVSAGSGRVAMAIRVSGRSDLSRPTMGSAVEVSPA